MAEKRTYRGNCHCAKFRFEVDLAEVKSATSCNCVACFKEGILWAFPADGDFRVTRDDGTLTSYRKGEALEYKVWMAPMATRATSMYELDPGLTHGARL
jgi:hypothetical protein